MVAVEELMVPKADLIIALTSTPLQDIARQLLAGRVGACPVLNDQAEPIGMVTQTDLVRAGFAGNTSCTAGDVMEGVLVMVRGTDTRQHVAATMAEHSIHHVLVTDTAGRLVGLVSALDVVNSLVTHG
eukprot:NODE_6599_length_519_cov_12.387755_g6434_i0.p2 GENE.NODE_6599_length_519_cov_12.387755_g6434_i0~~NODE_6599_length_519_cov_12.387755_g6434_i0.p2  ORF type:complete len:146 (-),score=59.70 NODE_6599_length_519_cov_12.387755_g6434_i0:80-463(-)